jgi:PAS domain S-box-containing protein
MQKNKLVKMENSIEYLNKRIIKLEESEKRFRSLYENATIGIYRSRPNGEIIFANPKFIDILGYSSFEELKKVDVESSIYLNSEYREKFKRIMEAEEVVHGFSVELVKKDGSKIFILESSRAIKDSSGKIEYYEGTIEDITKQKETEQALIQSEVKYRSIFQSGGSGIVITNSKNYFVEVNPRFCEILGYSQAELLKLTFLDVTHPDDIEKSKNIIGQLHSGEEKRVNIEKRYFRKDGSIIWGAISVGVMKDKDTGDTLNVGIFEDITARVNYYSDLQARDKVLSALSFSTETFLKTLDWQANLNEVLKRLGESLDVSRCYIFQNHLSENGEILSSQKYEWVNHGISSEINNPKMQNMPLNIFKKNKLEETLLQNRIFTELTKNFEGYSKQLMESQDIKSLLLVPIFESGNLWGFIGFDECITEREWTNQEIEALKTAGNLFGVAIKRKIFEEELLKAKIKAEESDKLKSNFLAQMSHEIRSPINSILSFSSLLKNNIGEDVDEELKASFEIISSAGKRITRTIDLILNMSEVQTGTYEYLAKTVDIYKDVLLTIIEEFNALAKTKNLDFVVINKTDDTKIVVDSYTVTQIFVNLVDNAFKYTNEGRIELKIERDENNKLVISVADTGIGISDKYLPLIFKAFSQEEQGYTRKFEGNGLGLALVKNYCDMNNAEIKVESKKDVGTTFTVSFN